MKPISTVLFAATIISSLLFHIRAPEAATETVLYSFCSLEHCTDGGEPTAIIDGNGTLYGISYTGGTGTGCTNQVGCGTVFSLDLTTGTEAVLHSFAGGSDGTDPVGLVNVRGRLYGATNGGGYYDAGTAFFVNWKTGHETVLNSFGCCSDGFYPAAGLIYHKGTLYGTTQGGGIHGNGTAFSMDPKTGAVTVLYSFCGQQNCADGAYPLQLTDADGMLYGMTEIGGVNNGGTVFSLDPATGVETVLYSFCSRTNCKDGGYPQSGLIDVRGRLYGTTEEGGAHDSGTLFSLDLNNNNEKVLHSFNEQGNDGWLPDAGLIDVNGTLYGTTSLGGSGKCESGNENDGCGTVFAFDLETGAESILYSFQNNGADGLNPDAGLINVNGTFYGTTELGGRNREGVVFSITP